MMQMVCTCGWKSEVFPDGTLFAGPGGELSCPDCSKAKRNRGIESWGNVDVISVGPFLGWQINNSRKQHLIHYFIGNKTRCGSKAKATGEYLIKEHWDSEWSKKTLEGWGKKFCPKCLSSVGGKELKP